MPSFADGLDETLQGMPWRQAARGSIEPTADPPDRQDYITKGPSKLDQARAGLQEIAGEPAVLLVSDTIRAALARFASASAPPLHVLAFGEIPEDKKVRVIATVGV